MFGVLDGRISCWASMSSAFLQALGILHVIIKCGIFRQGKKKPHSFPSFYVLIPESHDKVIQAYPGTHWGSRSSSNHGYYGRLFKARGTSVVLLQLSKKDLCNLLYFE